MAINDNSIANGIPARHISPETGSSGNATMTNKGGTSEGTNEASDSTPPPAAGLDRVTDSPSGEERTVASDDAGLFRRETAMFDTDLDTDEETAAQQIADGGDRIRHDDDEDEDGLER